MENGQLEYKPSAFYFRRALRNTESRADAIEIGMTVVSELEGLKAWVREQGLIPPKQFLLRCECDEKHWNVS